MILIHLSNIYQIILLEGLLAGQLLLNWLRVSNPDEVSTLFLF